MGRLTTTTIGDGPLTQIIFVNWWRRDCAVIGSMEASDRLIHLGFLIRALLHILLILSTIFFVAGAQGLALANGALALKVTNIIG